MLVDKGDLSMGTSWASSGMIHGGVRYLLSDVRTTKKSCKDSGYIQKIAPHLIFRIPLLMPLLKEDGITGRIKFEGANALFSLYDRFQPLKGGKPHVRLTRDEVRRVEPLLTPDAIGGVTTDEWGIDVPRLCIANALDAVEHDAKVKTWTKVTSLVISDGRVRGIRTQDELTGKVEEILADIVVNCAGPWVPKIAEMAGQKVRLRPAKGVHLVLDRRISNIGVIADAVDGRGVFVIPHENVSLIGTTDDDFYGDLDDLSVTEDEIEYLFQAVERSLPRIREARVIKTIAGIRPTLFERAKYEDDLTRDHRVVDHQVDGDMAGFVTLAGGKLAAYRVMAEQTADLVCHKLGKGAQCKTHVEPLPGGDRTPDIEELSRRYGMDPLAVRRLVFRQGSRAEQVLELIRDNPSYAGFVCNCDPIIEAELRYVIRNEMVRRAVDLIGRCHLAEGPCQGLECGVQAAIIFGEERGLSPQETAQEAFTLLQEKWRWRRNILSGVQLAGEELYRMIYQQVVNWNSWIRDREEVF